MTLLQPARDPGVLFSAHAIKLAGCLYSRNRQLHSLPLKRFSKFEEKEEKSRRFRCLFVSSSSSSGYGDFQWRLARSPFSSLYALGCLTARFSHAVSTLALFLGHKALQAKSTGLSLLHFSVHNDNDSSEKSGGPALRRRLSKRLVQQGGLPLALISTASIAKDHVKPIIATLCANPTFMSSLLAWAVAQVLKVFTTFFIERRWDFKMLLGSGGMPSSHSALCMALTTSVALCHGISDALFPVCLGFSLIVMYDAAGVRRHAGMQAEVLNLIVEDLFQGHPMSEKKLKELLGHTPLQVGAGALLGILAGYLCSQGYITFSGHGF
ncbi:hypothetical protein KP509_04G106500 [Ceratopteris richardii]|uniref:Acid phosphatase/vanadium-dependent haloperoxidase-related protein n=1 Tax=Ceratopteris richardii TaxID=49495 RepID=A0A8T2V3B7_CERRI|nr:hypothetical protein KP509_04G106500 [Ceratopteris richardii]